MHECNSFKNTKLAVYEQDRKMYRYVLCKQNNDLNSTKAPKLMKAIFHGCYSTKPISRKKNTVVRENIAGQNSLVQNALAKYIKCCDLFEIASKPGFIEK